MFWLDGKRALITGAGSGTGEASARLFATQGALGARVLSGVGRPTRGHPLALLVNDHGVVMVVGPIDAAVPHADHLLL
ncbi:MAG TPA: hypothetical protein VKB76_13630, partial [Ktedonobacterales bacterium]|nr:hypothetical protein [Ktedonobacterales bacterium]